MTPRAMSSIHLAFGFCDPGVNCNDDSERTFARDDALPDFDLQTIRERLEKNEMMKLPRCFLLMCVLSALATDARADINGFGNFSGFTINQNDNGPSPTVSAGNIRLTNAGAVTETRSIFYGTPQPVGHFTASFTYQALNGTVPDEDSGICFVLQNAPTGVHAIGSSFAYYLGYGQGNVSPSAASSLELGLDFSSVASASGMYTNGSVGVGSAPSTSPVNLESGDPINVTLSYNGSILQETLLDTTTSATYTNGYLTNLPATLGNSTALVGFTGGMNGSFGPDQYISNFQFVTSVPEPSTAILLSVGMIGILGCAFRLQANRACPSTCPAVCRQRTGI
jgi:hypothetical protein